MYFIKFEGKCDFTLGKMSLQNIQHSNIKSVVLGSDAGDFFCEITSSHSNERKAIIGCDEYVHNLVSIILYETGYQIRKIEWKSIENINAENSDNNALTFRGSVGIRAEIKIIKPIEDPVELKSKLENISTNIMIGYKKLFIEITKFDDALAKFILFYSILTALKGNQKLVDNFIKSIEPAVEVRPTTRENANFNETIYSFLRNQIGHTQETTDTNELHKEISLNLNGLREIVKVAIEEND